MEISKDTLDYVEDRVNRIMSSHKKIHAYTDLTEDQKIEEIAKMVTWHIERVISDQKSQLKYVIGKNLSKENTLLVNGILNRFKMKVLPYKSVVVKERGEA